MVVEDLEDPIQWDIERVVHELTKPEGRLRKQYPKRYPDPILFELALRSNHIDGEVLLSIIDTTVLRNELGIKSIGHLHSVVVLIDLLREESRTAGARSKNITVGTPQSAVAQISVLEQVPTTENVVDQLASGTAISTPKHTEADNTEEFCRPKKRLKLSDNHRVTNDIVVDRAFDSPLPAAWKEFEARWAPLSSDDSGFPLYGESGSENDAPSEYLDELEADRLEDGKTVKILAKTCLSQEEVIAVLDKSIEAYLSTWHSEYDARLADKAPDFWDRANQEDARGVQIAECTREIARLTKRLSDQKMAFLLAEWSDAKDLRKVSETMKTTVRDRTMWQWKKDVLELPTMPDYPHDNDVLQDAMRAEADVSSAVTSDKDGDADSVDDDNLLDHLELSRGDEKEGEEDNEEEEDLEDHGQEVIEHAVSDPKETSEIEPADEDIGENLGPFDTTSIPEDPLLDIIEPILGETATDLQAADDATSLHSSQAEPVADLATAKTGMDVVDLTEVLTPSPMSTPLTQIRPKVEVVEEPKTSRPVFRKPPTRPSTTLICLDSDSEGDNSLRTKTPNAPLHKKVDDIFNATQPLQSYLGGCHGDLLIALAVSASSDVREQVLKILVEGLKEGSWWILNAWEHVSEVDSTARQIVGSKILATWFIHWYSGTLNLDYLTRTTAKTAWEERAPKFWKLLKTIMNRVNELRRLHPAVRPSTSPRPENPQQPSTQQPSHSRAEPIRKPPSSDPPLRPLPSTQPTPQAKSHVESRFVIYTPPRRPILSQSNAQRPRIQVRPLTVPRRRPSPSQSQPAPKKRKLGSLGRDTGGLPPVDPTNRYGGLPPKKSRSDTVLPPPPSMPQAIPVVRGSDSVRTEPIPCDGASSTSFVRLEPIDGARRDELLRAPQLQPVEQPSAVTQDPWQFDGAADEDFSLEGNGKRK